MFPPELTRLELLAKRSEQIATRDRADHAIAAIDYELARYEAPLLASPKRSWVWLLAICAAGLAAASYTSKTAQPAAAQADIVSGSAER